MKQIIVVDSDTEVRDLIEAFFKPKGFNVRSFPDAESAIQECKLTGNEWDVLLTDYHFPKMSVLDFTADLKKVLPHLPIILITQAEHSDKALEAIKHGAYDFVVKPIHFPQLKIAVERALHLNDLKGDLIELRERVKHAGKTNSKIIGRSPKFLAALDLARRVAPSSANILITGESGTGKEVFANFIHAESAQKKGPFVAINCSAIPEGLLESELFGHSKGAFTGAQGSRAGLFEEAQDGTLFLDEIGDLSLPLQAKLLRVLQERTIRRVGENQIRAINCRIISATHKHLETAVREQHFREDLYFRLNVIPIEIPPLRDRREDLLQLAEAFLRRYALENGSPAKTLSREANQYILENNWRGNVRELENVIERAVVLCTGAEISLSDLVSPRSVWIEKQDSPETEVSTNRFTIQYGDHLPTVEEVVHRFIEHAVNRNGGARDKTAKEIGIDRKTLYKRLATEFSIAH